MRVMAWIAVLACAPAVAYAQIADHCTTPEAGPRASRFEAAPAPALAKVEGLFVSGHAGEGLLVIGNPVTGDQAGLRLDSRVRFRADKKTRLSAQRDLSLADFQEGDPLWVTLQRTDGRVVELRLRAVD